MKKASTTRENVLKLARIASSRVQLWSYTYDPNKVNLVLKPVKPLQLEFGLRPSRQGHPRKALQLQRTRERLWPTQTISRPRHGTRSVSPATSCRCPDRAVISATSLARRSTAVASVGACSRWRSPHLVHAAALAQPSSACPVTVTAANPAPRPAHVQKLPRPLQNEKGHKSLTTPLPWKNDR